MLLIDAMRQPGTSDDALRPICGALRSFATADDLRPTTSRYMAQHAASMFAHLRSCVGNFPVHCCISQLFPIAVMRSTYLLLMATLWVAVLTVLHAEFIQVHDAPASVVTCNL